MITVGIRELKAKLSHYIDRVGRGERILITEHGKEVALLVPVSEERKAVRRLPKSGEVQWSGGKPVGVREVRIQGEPLSETILRERG